MPICPKGCNIHGYWTKVILICSRPPILLVVALFSPHVVMSLEKIDERNYWSQVTSQRNTVASIHVEMIGSTLGSGEQLLDT